MRPIRRLNSGLCQLALRTVFLALLARGVAAQEADEGRDEPPIRTISPSVASLHLSKAGEAQIQEALKAKDYKRAEEILVEEVAKDPTSLQAAKIYVLAGHLFFLDGQYLNSAISWEKAEAIAPVGSQTRFTLAMANIRLGRRDRARRELEKLVDSDPKNASYIYWLARLDYDAKNYTEAIAKFHQVISLDSAMMRAYENLGLCYDYLGQYGEAVLNYNKAIELNRLQKHPSAWPHLNFAVTLASLNRLTEAEAQLREALRYESGLAHAHYQLGLVLEMEGEFEEAVLSLEQAIKLDAKYPEPHYTLARVYKKMGRTEDARKEVDRFKELKDEAPPAQPAVSQPN
jgi:tetratricopeptide (TPR) repeat protein